MQTHPADAQTIGCVDLMVDRHVRAGRGDCVALVEAGASQRRELCYRALQFITAEIAQRLCADLGGPALQQRRIAIIGSSTLETVCWWLGAMRAGHLVYLVHPDLPGDYAAVLEAFQPDRVYRDRTAQLAIGHALAEVHAPDCAVM